MSCNYLAPFTGHRPGCPDLASPLAAATTDGIATGLSRALVALEARKQELGKVSSRDAHDRGRAHEAAMSARLVRELLEALVDGPTDPGEKLAQR